MSYFLGHRRTQRALWRRLPRMAGFVLRLLVAQESLLFQPQPRRARRATPGDLGLPWEPVRLGETASGRTGGGQTGGGPIAGCRIAGWWIPGDPARPAVLLLPGAIGDLAGELPTVGFLHGLGLSVLAIDWPGFGASGGRPGVRACRAAAAAAREHLAARRPDGDLVLYGRSFGSLLAARLAAEHPCRALVFHDGFPSVPAFVARFLPGWLVGPFCTVRLSCEDALRRRRCPALFLHAEADEVVSSALGRRAYAGAAAPKRFLATRGGHFGGEWRHDPRVAEAWRELLDGAAARWDEQTGEAA